MRLSSNSINEIVERALKEDLGSGDITTRAIQNRSHRARGSIRAKQKLVVCGQTAAREVFRQLSPKNRYRTKIADGKVAQNGDLIAEIDGNLNTLLSGERTALNLLMHLSGIATLAAKFVEKTTATQAVILDTRKTFPGLRLLQKYAVVTGGARNHRIGLYDMYLIKDNHIQAAGSIEDAILQVLNDRGRKRIKIEVETKSMDEIRSALKFKIDRIMLDNMSLSQMKHAVELIREVNPGIEIEASGNVSLKTVRKIAQTGVDFISAGALTHSAPAADISMEIELV
jgi:nicotinate-nucleotide pyrophosphorylase (carboxylating)